MQPNITKTDVMVIGGGVSGLSSAYKLHESGCKVLLLEKNNRLGGSIQTKNMDDFIIDCGPNSTLETSPQIRTFIEDLGLADERIYANQQAKKRYILRGGKLEALPATPLAFIKSKLFSTRAKFRLLAEPFIAPAPEGKEETVAEFVTRRLGREFLDYAINPFIAGVYAGDPKKLCVRNAVAKVYALEKNYGSLIKGAVQGARKRKKSGEVEKTKAELFSFKTGMSCLINRLSEKLGNAILTDTEIKSIHKNENYYSVIIKTPRGEKTVETRAILFTTPAYATAELLRGFSQPLAGTLREIRYPAVAMVFVGYKKQPDCRPLDGFGYLIPEVEKRNTLGVIWSSTIFPQRTPENGVALTTFVGGDRQPEIALKDKDELLKIVQADLKGILNLNAKPDVVHIQQWKKAIPQYTIGHGKRMAEVERFEAQFPGLFISGNFRGGISVGDCIVNSSATFKKIKTFISEKPSESDAVSLNQD